MRGLLRLMGSRLARLDGTVAAEVKAPVTIRRDAHGIAYVEAQNPADAFFGFGFAQGQDRSFQIDLFVRVARGTLAALVGKDGLEPDRLARRLGFRKNALAQFALFDPQTRTEFEAFARGLNAGRAASPKPHEFALLAGAAEPFEATDPLTMLQFLAFALSSNWDAELARLHILQSDGPLALRALEAADPALLATDAEVLGRLSSDIALLSAAEQFAAGAMQATATAGVGGASNNWVLAASKTSTGRPLLACDPHLMPTIPAPWYLVHVRCPEWAMAGGAYPGQPTVSFGHNGKVAWGLTAGHADNTDLFVEKLGPDGKTALRGDRWVPCALREEVIRVKGGKDVVETVVTTPTGPVVTPVMRAGGTALSLRGAWMAPRPIRAYGSHHATDVHSARALFDGYPSQSENRLFADVAGNIAWQMTGDVPVRKKGHGLLPMPAWDERAGWEDLPLPFSQMPGATNPPEGFLATANAAPPGSSVFLGADWLDPGRHRRIHALLAARSDWDVASALAMQLDRTTGHWATLKAPLLAALAPAPKGAERAHVLLQGWDGVVATQSEGAAVYEVLFAELVCRACKTKAPKSWQQAVGEGLNNVLEHGMMALRRSAHTARLIAEQPDGWFARGWREEIRDALVAAQSQLEAKGSDWAWGRLRPVTLMHATGKIPVLKSIFNVGPIPFGGDGSTLPQASVPFDHPFGNPISLPNLRMAIDVGNWEATRFILAGGQSGNPLSPHYADQVPQWERGETIALPWAAEAVARVTTHTLKLEPAGPGR